MSGIRIFLLTGSFTFGGTERYIFNLLRHINKEKFNITVGCFRQEGHFTPPSDIESVVFPLRGLRWFLTDLPILVRLICFLKQRNFDLIYATHFQTNVYLSLASIFCRKPALVIGYRGINRMQGSFGKIITRICTGLAAIVLVNSDAARRTLSDQVAAPRTKIRVVHNGIEYKSSDGEKKNPLDLSKVKTIGTIGRMHRLKGHRVLLEAYRRLESIFPDTRLIFVGDGEERMALEQRARELGVSSKVLFTGFQADIESVLREIDIFVLPSITESFPNALLEAMAHGIPSIATRVGGTMEIVEDGKDGLLVDPGDAEQLSSAISAVLKDSSLSMRLASAGRKKAAFFSMDRMIRETESVLVEAAALKRINPSLEKADRRQA